jgi:flagellar biosynthesis protein FlhA
MKAVRMDPERKKAAPRSPIRVWMGQAVFTLVSQKSNIFYRGLQGLISHFRLQQGVLLPPFDFSLRPQLPPESYCVELSGQVEPLAELRLGRRLAVGEDDVLAKFLGEPGHEPIYGMQGKWILPSFGEQAAQLGCFVAEPEALIVSHLMERIYGRLPELLTSQSVSTLLDELSEDQPALVKAVLARFSLAKIRKVLQMLLQEGIALVELSEILEGALACDRSGSTDVLASVRQALARHIVGPLLDNEGELPVLSLAGWVEKKWLAEIRGDGPVEPWFCQLFLENLAAEREHYQSLGHSPALMVDSDLRWTLVRLVERNHNDLAVLSWNEVPSDCRVNELAVIGSRMHPLVGGWPCSRQSTEQEP